MKTSRLRNGFLILLGIAVLALPETAFAGWGLNLGYNNPPGSTLGLNLMNIGQQWAFEIGVGGVQQNNNSSSSTTSILGDLNFKYLAGSSGIRPYLQFGAGSAASVNTGSGGTANVGVGGLFAGAGLMAVGQKLYMYVSADIGQGGGGFFQGGLGFNF